MHIIIKSPVGNLRINESDDHITEVAFTEEELLLPANLSPAIEATKKQLEAYFIGELEQFDLPLAPLGTDFQRKVWRELEHIPYGQTTSYLDMAKKLGDEKVIRAAATANGKNPIAIIIPCHRVIGSNGDLIGYAGGLERKQWLLKHEGAIKQLDIFAA
jgi:methylated-DNA-[protein]-cysteine S-methyltransferase